MQAFDGRALNLLALDQVLLHDFQEIAGRPDQVSCGDGRLVYLSGGSLTIDINLGGNYNAGQARRQGLYPDFHIS